MNYRTGVLGHGIIGLICGHSGHVRGPRRRDEERYFFEVLK